jgi:hypothetical protein
MLLVTVRDRLFGSGVRARIVRHHMFCGRARASGCQTSESSTSAGTCAGSVLRQPSRSSSRPNFSFWAFLLLPFSHRASWRRVFWPNR